MSTDSTAAWSVLVTVNDSGLTKQAREAIFTAICEAVMPFEDQYGEIDVSGQPLDELSREHGRMICGPWCAATAGSTRLPGAPAPSGTGA